MNSTIVVALGGNALQEKGDKGTYEEQKERVEKTCKNIVGMIKKGHHVIVTHGNGPQVGAVLIQQENKEVPGMPLHACGAQTQGMIGYMIQNSLRNQFKMYGLPYAVVTLVTQVLVDKNDPAFKNPTKYIGPFYSKEEAEALKKEKSYTIIQDSDRGYRRVVASPIPKDIVEKEAVKSLIHSNNVVIAGGGGGIPVVNTKKGLQGIDAVIDKDLAAQVLAKEVHADTLMILTSIDKVSLFFGTDKQEDLDKITLAEAQIYQEQGHFPPGSMGPKIEAAIRFLRSGGKE